MWEAIEGFNTTVAASLTGISHGNGPGFGDLGWSCRASGRGEREFFDHPTRGALVAPFNGVGVSIPFSPGGILPRAARYQVSRKFGAKLIAVIWPFGQMPSTQRLLWIWVRPSPQDARRGRWVVHLSVSGGKGTSSNKRRLAGQHAGK